MSPSKESRVTVSGTSSYYSKATYVRFSMGGTRISGCFSQRTSATGRLVCVQTSPWRRHPPLSVNGPTDCLPQLYRQQGDLESMRQEILLLFYSSLDAAVSISVLHQCTPHQACVYSPLLEVQLAVDSQPDLPGLAGAQCLSQDHMCEDEGSLRNSTSGRSPLATPNTRLN